MQYAPINTLHVDVLDQDDNPPMAQGNHSIDVILPEFTAVSDAILSSCLLDVRMDRPPLLSIIRVSFVNDEDRSSK